MTTTSKCQNLLFDLHDEIIKLEVENATLKERLNYLELQKTNISDSDVKRVDWIELEPGKRFLTKKDLGKYLGISAGTISNKMSKGVFPIRSKRIGNKIRFDMREILEYLDTDMPFWERDKETKQSK